MGTSAAVVFLFAGWGGAWDCESWDSGAVCDVSVEDSAASVVDVSAVGCDDEEVCAGGRYVCPLLGEKLARPPAIRKAFLK